MKTRLLQPSDDGMETAREILDSGGLVAIPTETVYGLAANALNENAVRRVFEAKSRPPSNPLIVHVSDWNSAQNLIAASNQEAKLLTDAFWPGPLSIVLPRSSNVSDLITAGGNTVAIRSPNHPVALELIRICGFPLVAPSANRSSGISPTRIEHVFEELEGKIDAVLDGGPCEVGIESTVLDLTVSPLCILRPGAISSEEISKVLNQNVTHDFAVGNDALRSPGILGKHYSPKTPLFCIESPMALAQAEVLVTFYKHPNAVVISENPLIAAQELYKVLRELDTDELNAIYVVLPPDTEEWHAIRNRLLRAQGSLTF